MRSLHPLRLCGRDAGHTHLNTTHWLHGRTGRIPVVGIASGSQNFGGHKPPSAYNLFHIDGERGNWSLRKERFSLTADNTTFARDDDEVLAEPDMAAKADQIASR